MSTDRRDRPLPRARRALGGDAARVRLRPSRVRELARRARPDARSTSTRGSSPTTSASSVAAADRLAASSISRRLAAVRSCLRYTLRAGCGARGARSHRGGRDGSRTRRRPRRSRRSSSSSRATPRSRSATARSSSSSTRQACAARRRSALDLADVDFDREAIHVRGKGGKERVVPLGEEAALPPRPVPARREAGARDAAPSDAVLPLGPRQAARHEHRAAAGSPPAPAPARIRHAPARGRRRPPRHPGAPRPLLALDDAGLQPRRRTTAAARLRPLAPAQLTRAGQCWL